MRDKKRDDAEMIRLAIEDVKSGQLSEKNFMSFVYVLTSQIEVLTRNEIAIGYDILHYFQKEVKKAKP